jgi:hypothetical protein
MEIVAESPLGCSEVTSNSSPDRPRVDRKKDARKSRIGNGSALLPGIDGRSAWVRRCKDVIAAHLADLGGIDNCSTAEYSLVRRASTLTVELERFEAKFATAGEASPEDLEIYQRCANSLRRLLEAVGLQRRAKLVSSLGDVIREDQQAQRLRLVQCQDEAAP